MGKKRGSEDFVEDSREAGSLSTKKHKKHKHKKHKKKKIESDAGCSDTTKSNLQSSQFPLIQLTFNRPSGMMNSKMTGTLVAGVSPKSAKKKKVKESETSSDEERWLDAIQSGKLDEVDEELKQIKNKDLKLMTARQRAMLERRGDSCPDPAAEQLLSLPSGYKKEKILSPEMMQKAALKRKQLVEEKREKDQKRTMERLLGKQGPTRSVRPVTTKRIAKKATVTVILLNQLIGSTMLLPPGVDYPLTPQVVKKAPAPVYCGVRGCTKKKKYNCSRTNIPLCSLECYKANLKLHASTELL